jgi:regulator of RNase E activity RraA
VPLVGRAFTVRVDAAGHVDRAITGEPMVAHAASRGALGVIVDGAVPDAELLADLVGCVPVNPAADH